jgi:hypothetical protein
MSTIPNWCDSRRLADIEGVVDMQKYLHCTIRDEARAQKIMMDRLLHFGLWLSVIGMITVASAICLFLGYGGIFDLIAGHYPHGSALLGASLLLGVGAYSLSCHGNELIDR